MCVERRDPKEGQGLPDRPAPRQSFPKHLSSQECIPGSGAPTASKDVLGAVGGLRGVETRPLGGGTGWKSRAAWWKEPCLGGLGSWGLVSHHPGQLQSECLVYLGPVSLSVNLGELNWKES